MTIEQINRLISNLEYARKESEYNTSWGDISINGQDFELIMKALIQLRKEVIKNDNRTNR